MAFSYQVIPTRVTIGAESAPDPAAMLEIKSTTGGLLLPRMSTAQRDLLAAPVPNGMTIYNTTNSQVEVYSTGAWSGVGGSSGLAGWVTATAYVIGNTVIHDATLYLCIVDHTSGVFAADLLSGYWQEIDDSNDVKAIVSSTDEAVVRWDGTTGRLVQDSAVVIGDTGAVTGVESIAVGGTLDATSILDVTSTTLGSRPCPSMTEVQRDAIVTPATGLCIFNATTSKLNVYNSTAWVSAGGGLSEWITATAYEIGDVVHNNNLIYKALTDHTSGVFATDLANNNWIQLSDYSDHGSQTGLADDDHPHYALLAGRSGGQILYGGTGAGDDLSIYSTSNATKGTVTINGTLSVDEAATTTTVTGPTYHPDGTVGAPSISYTSDTNTGSYRAGNDWIAWSIGGTNRMDLSSTRLKLSGPRLDMYPASAAAPTIVNVNDTTNGIWFEADAVDISSGGVNNMQFSDTANVFDKIAAYSVAAMTFLAETSDTADSSAITISGGGGTGNTRGGSIKLSGNENADAGKVTIESGAASTVELYAGGSSASVVSISGTAATFKQDMLGDSSGLRGKAYLDVLKTGEADYAALTDLSSGNNATFDGGGSITGTLSLETSSLIDAGDSKEFLYSGSTANDYWYHTTTQPDENKALYFKFNYTYTGTSAVTGDVKVKAKCTTAGTEIYSEDLEQASSSSTHYDSLFVPSGCGTVKIGFHIVTGRTSGKVYWNRFAISGNPLTTLAEIYDTQEYRLTQAGNAMTDRTAEAEFNLGTASITNTGDSIIYASDDSGSTRTKFIANRKCIVNINYAAHLVTTNRNLAISKNGTITEIGSENFSANRMSSVAGSLELAAGEYFTVGSSVDGSSFSGDIVNGGDNTRLVFTAFAKNESNVTPNEIFEPIKYTTNAGQSIADATTTRINFEDKAFDDDALVTTGSSWAWTAPRNGKIQLSGQVAFAAAAWAVNDIINMRAYVNGAATDYIYRYEVADTITSDILVVSGPPVTLNVAKGDTIAWSVYQDSTGARTLETSGECNYVGIMYIDGGATFNANPIQRTQYIHVNATAALNNSLLAQTTSYKTRGLESVSGDSIGSINTGTDEYSIGAGKYEFEIPVGAHGADADDISLDVYDGSSTLIEVGEVVHGLTTNDAAWNTAKFTLNLTSAKVLQFRTKGESTTGSEGIGRIKVTKIK